MPDALPQHTATISVENCKPLQILHSLLDFCNQKSLETWMDYKYIKPEDRECVLWVTSSQYSLNLLEWLLCKLSSTAPCQAALLFMVF